MKTETINPDAVCGNCGKAFVDHYHEDEDYCFVNTNADLFTEEPSEYALVAFIESTHADVYAKMVDEWKQRHGHQPERSAE